MMKAGALKKTTAICLAGAYFTSAFLWTWPNGPSRPKWFDSIKEKQIRPTFKFLHLYQNWSMFAPDPIRFERKVEAHIYRHDGSRAIWELPSYRHGWLLNRILGEAERKWSLDNIRLNKNHRNWPPLARYLKERFDQLKPENPVREVRLVRLWKKKYFNSLTLHDRIQNTRKS